MRLTMLCLSGFELYSRWVPLLDWWSLMEGGHLQELVAHRGSTVYYIGKSAF